MEWVKVRWKENVRTLLDVDYKELVAEVGGLDCGEAVGVDPGRNFAVAFVQKTGDKHRISIPYGYFRVGTYEEDGAFAYDFIRELVMNYTIKNKVAMVEGAAHSSHHGQANLAYVRFGFYLGLKRAFYDVEMIAPNSARKRATGHGNKAMWALLPNMNHNACDALGVALAAAGYDVSKEE